MPTLNFIDQSEAMSGFITSYCPEVKDAQLDAACHILARYNLRRPNQPIFSNEIIAIPNDLEQQLCIGAQRYDTAPQLGPEQNTALRALLKQHSGDEILAMSEIMESLPANDDTLKAFAGGLLGASRTRGNAYIQALQGYSDSLMQWKNTPKKQRNKINIEKVQPAYDKLNNTFKSELDSMANKSRVLRDPKQGMRVLRSRQHSINLTGSKDVQRLQRFLKIARVSAYGAIIIDAGLAGQKVQDARDAGENAEKVAYEEYAALIGGIAFAGAITAFFGPGLIILTVVGGVSALTGAKFGREIGKSLYEQISAYEAAMPPERKKQLLSESALSAL